MRCKVEGQPLPEVTWYFNGNQITPGTDYHVISDVYEFFLTIPRATINMGGKYTVKAKNKYGEEECYTILTVEGKQLLPLYLYHHNYGPNNCRCNYCRYLHCCYHQFCNH